MSSGKAALPPAIQTYSRFALLEEDSVSVEEKVEKEAEKKSNAVKNAKRRARKKKKAVAETNDLRNLAFSKPVSAKAIQNVHHERHAQPEMDGDGMKIVSPPKGNNPIENVDPDWETWRNKDEEFVINQFQRDLESAMRISAECPEAPHVAKVKKKVKTMSLEEFVATEPETTATHEQAPPLDTFYIRNGYSPEELDPNHYHTYTDNNILSTTEVVTTTTPTPQKKKKKKKKTTDNNTLSEVLQELHTEVVNDSNSSTTISGSISGSIDAASVASYENIINEKDKEVTRLNEVNEKLKEELSQVKKRNKQFCFILAQGEMKDKSEILLQVDELTNVKNELSEELAEMHILLEQERSKVSSLKSELDKQQQSQRSKSKSTSEEK